MAGKILLVEDDPNFRAVLAVALEIQGYLVRQAACGQGALEELNREVPDIIISDLEMGGIDGRALCKYTRATAKLAGIPFVILSAFVEPGGPGTLVDLPADSCVSKQVSISELSQLINDLLGRAAKGSLSGGN
jgi:DNA-binding response OmpR family regulator